MISKKVDKAIAIATWLNAAGGLFEKPIFFGGSNDERISARKLWKSFLDYRMGGKDIPFRNQPKSSYVKPLDLPYKKAQRRSEASLRHGRVLWEGGTYRKDIHGPIGTSKQRTSLRISERWKSRLKEVD